MTDDGADAAARALAEAETAHVPVLLREVVAALAPERGGVFVDGTFGAGGYARALLEAGADRVIGLDRDPTALARARRWAPFFGARLTLVETRFSALDNVCETPLDGVCLDIGVSSMQIDQAERGFSFQKDGPLDMRMGGDGVSAADLVDEESAETLAALFRAYGEERRARALAEAIVAAREQAPIRTTRALAEIIEARSPRPKPGQPHAATRVFQALRIAVNDELGELVAALGAAERVLAPGGRLAVVTFHSLEDRIVKRFFAERSGASGGGGSRHEPPVNRAEASFTLMKPSPITPTDAEIAANPRARSAKLRVGVRTAAEARPLDAAALGAPDLAATGGGTGRRLRPTARRGARR